MIIPTILEKDFAEVEKKVKVLDKVAPIIQVDIVSSEMVNGSTFSDVKKIEELDTTANIELDLFVKYPTKYLEYKLKNVSHVILHIESSDDVFEEIIKAKALGYIVGIGISPETSINKLDAVVEYIDYVQFMTVVPGAQGRPFIPSVLDVVKDFKQQYPRIKLQADGGINHDNIKQIKDAGIVNFVVGSAIVNASDPIKEYNLLEKLI